MMVVLYLYTILAIISHFYPTLYPQPSGKWCQHFHRIPETYVPKEQSINKKLCRCRGTVRHATNTKYCTWKGLQ